MLAGIALLGTITAIVASWFVQRVTETEQSQVATRNDVRSLADEVAELRSRLGSGS